MKQDQCDSAREAGRDALKQRLLELGLLTEIRAPLRGTAIPTGRQPVPVEGNPVSDLIVRERR